MKKYFGLILVMVLFSCSSDSTDSSFDIDVTMTNPTVNIDEHVEITILSPEEIQGIEYSYDNFKTSVGEFSVSNFVKSKVLSFRFHELGSVTLFFRVIDRNNVKSQTKVITLNIVKGNRVKIVGLKLNSFNGTNTSWDPEYAATDPNRLADVFLYFEKIYYNDALSDGRSLQVWYKTSVKENQGDLTWSFINDNLYIDPNSYIYFSLRDADGPSWLVQDLNHEYYTQNFNLRSYASTKPSSVKFTYPKNIEFILELEWSK